MENVHIDPVESFVFDGLIARLSAVFGCVAVYGGTQDRVKVVEKFFEGRTVQYPYIFAALTTVSTNPDSYVTNRLARTGVTTFVRSSENSMHQVRLMPTNFELEVTYVTNELMNYKSKSVIEFTRRWLFARRNGYLKFNIKYGESLALRIGTTLAESLSIPPLENKTELAAEYVLSTTLTVHGFMSEPILKHVGIVKEVQLETKVQANPDVKTFWSFGSH